MPDIKSMTLKELEQYMEEIGEKKFRAKQLYEWMHKKLARNFDDMHNLPKSLKQKIQSGVGMLSVKEVQRYTSKIDGTAKFLFELYDGSIIETVLMRYKHGNSVCISSQAGCRMGCRVLCFDDRWPDKIFGTIRNAGSDLSYSICDQGNGYRMLSLWEQGNRLIILIIYFVSLSCSPMNRD